MITLGLPLYILAHDVTQGATTVTIQSAAWASPLTYLEAVLVALSQTATVTGVEPSRLRLTATGTPADLVWANTTDGNIAAAYVGADTRVLAFGADSEITTYLWTGSEARVPGLQPRIFGHDTTTRAGLHGQPGVIAQDELTVWPSKGDASDLAEWYEFALNWLAGAGACEIRCGTSTTVWYLLETEMMLEEVKETDGSYTRCSLPVCRGV